MGSNESSIHLSNHLVTSTCHEHLPLGHGSTLRITTDDSILTVPLIYVFLSWIFHAILAGKQYSMLS